MKPSDQKSQIENRKFQLVTRSAQETRNLGEHLGKALNGPITIALFGDLGSGKTALVQGLARGLSVAEEYAVTSPSFTLVNEYPGRLPLIHVDLYRLEGVPEDLGMDEVLGGSGVVAVEWAERLSPGTLSECLEIRLSIIDDNCRRFQLTGHGTDAGRLVKELEKTWSGATSPPPRHEGTKKEFEV